MEITTEKVPLFMLAEVNTLVNGRVINTTARAPRYLLTAPNTLVNIRMVKRTVKALKFFLKAAENMTVNGRKRAKTTQRTMGEVDAAVDVNKHAAKSSNEDFAQLERDGAQAGVNSTSITMTTASEEKVSMVGLIAGAAARSTLKETALAKIAAQPELSYDDLADPGDDLAFGADM